MTMIFRFFTSILFLMAISAHAHETHGKPQYGGAVADAGIFQAELVLKQSVATIYLTEHGKDVSSKGTTGKLTMLSGEKKFMFSLTPSKGNQLQATLAEPFKKGTFVAQITQPSQPTATLRFEIK